MFSFTSKSHKSTAILSAGAAAMAVGVLLAAQTALASTTPPTYTSTSTGGDWQTNATWGASSSPGENESADTAAVNGPVTLGGTVANSLNKVTVNGGGTLTFGSGSNLAVADGAYIGAGGTGTGTMDITNGSTINITSTTNSNLAVGVSTTVAGVVNQTGGNVTVEGSFLGADQKNDTLANSYTISGGSLTVGYRFRNGNNGTCAFVVDGGSVSAGGDVRVAEVGNGTLTINAGQFTSSGAIDIAQSTGTGTLNLNGGTLASEGLVSGSAGTGILNFNGGTFQAYTGSSATISSSTLLTANVQAGGAVFDSNGQTITVDQNLISDPTTSGGTDGGLTLNDTSTSHNGKLILSDTGNTYNGNTTVNDGTLEIKTAFLATTSIVTIDATYAHMILDYSGTDYIQNLVLGGQTMAAGVYGYGLDSGDYNSFFTTSGGTNGTLTVSAAVPAPATLSLVAIGGLGLLLIGRKRSRKLII